VTLLDDITARSAEIRERLRDLLAWHEHSGDTKTLALVAYVDLAYLSDDRDAQHQRELRVPSFLAVSSTNKEPFR